MSKEDKTNTKLNGRQQRFISEYVIDCNATQAAIRAGYSKRTAKEQGYRLFTNVHIQEEINNHRDKAQKRTEISVDLVLEGLKKVALRSLEAEPILDAKGKPTGQYRFNAAGANRAFELIGKQLGMFSGDSADKQENGILESLLKSNLEIQLEKQKNE